MCNIYTSVYDKYYNKYYNEDDLCCCLIYRTECLKIGYFCIIQLNFNSTFIDQKIFNCKFEYTILFKYFLIEINA